MIDNKSQSYLGRDGGGVDCKAIIVENVVRYTLMVGFVNNNPGPSRGVKTRGREESNG